MPTERLPKTLYVALRGMWGLEESSGWPVDEMGKKHGRFNQETGSSRSGKTTGLGLTLLKSSAVARSVLKVKFFHFRCDFLTYFTAFCLSKWCYEVASKARARWSKIGGCTNWTDFKNHHIELKNSPVNLRNIQFDSRTNKYNWSLSHVAHRIWQTKFEINDRRSHSSKRRFMNGWGMNLDRLVPRHCKFYQS